MRGSKTSWMASSLFLLSDNMGRTCTSCSKMEREPRLLRGWVFFPLPFCVESRVRLLNTIMIICVVLRHGKQISTFIPQRRQKLLNIGMSHKLLTREKFIHCQIFWVENSIFMSHTVYDRKHADDVKILPSFACNQLPIPTSSVSYGHHPCTEVIEDRNSIWLRALVTNAFGPINLRQTVGIVDAIPNTQL